MSLVVNLFLIFVLILIIVLVLIHSNKSINSDKLETCFTNCNSNCDKNNPASYYDLCKKRCAIKCGDETN